MAIKFTPNGALDITTDPQDLPEQASEKHKHIVSGAMTRCTNLNLDRAGVAETRNGSEWLNTTALTKFADFLIEQGLLEDAAGLLRKLKEALSAAGIDVPFPQREVRILGTPADSRPAAV